MTWETTWRMPYPASQWNLWHLRQANPKWYPLCLTVNTISWYPHHWTIPANFSIKLKSVAKMRTGPPPQKAKMVGRFGLLDLNWPSRRWHPRRFRNCPSHLLKQLNPRISDIGWNNLHDDVGDAYSEIPPNASVLKIEWLTGRGGGWTIAKFH